MRHLLATYEVDEESVDEIKELAREFVMTSRSELGCIYYDAFQNAEHPTRFHHAMGFSNESALREHQKTANFKRFVRKVSLACTDPPQYTILRALVTPNAEEGPDFEDDNEE